MPRGVYDRKQKDDPAMESETAAQVQPSEKMFPVLLTKNYVPSGAYEIVGYLKEAVKRKDAAGSWRVVEPEEFIKGEMKPHTSHGVGFAGKIWAGTQIRLPMDEAKTVIAKKIAERADAIAA
jgi:hypothetical protein